MLFHFKIVELGTVAGALPILLFARKVNFSAICMNACNMFVGLSRDIPKFVRMEKKQNDF